MNKQEIIFCNRCKVEQKFAVKSYFKDRFRNDIEGYDYYVEYTLCMCDNCRYTVNVECSYDICDVLSLPNEDFFQRPEYENYKIKALKAQGFGVHITEWWEQSPLGNPNTYKAVLNVINRPLNKKEITLAERTFNQTKRHSQHGTLSFALQPSPSEVFTASAVVSGVTTTVYPG